MFQTITLMKKVKITVLRKTQYDDLIALYERPLANPCNMNTGDVYVVADLIKPSEFCQSAWETLYPFIEALSMGGGDFFDGWMKNPYSALLSCNDGFRPVSFLIETI